MVNIGGSNYVATLSSPAELMKNTAYTYNITVSKTGLTVTGSTIGTWNEYNNGTAITGTANLYIPPVEVDLSEMTEALTINDNGTYRLTGQGTQPIYISACSPTIYLDGASIDLSNTTIHHAIEIKNGASPTFYVQGKENEFTSGYDTMIPNFGIYVASGCSVTIEGGSRDDVLTAQSEMRGAGIGGGGDITIRNITVNASGKHLYPGIGGEGACGTITIENATVIAYGGGTSGDKNGELGTLSRTQRNNPAIGVGLNGTVPTIKISDSEIYAYRGGYDGTSYGDWIGKGGNFSDYSGGTIQCGEGGSITKTTVYAGMNDCGSGTLTKEKVFIYDENGEYTLSEWTE